MAEPNDPAGEDASLRGADLEKDAATTPNPVAQRAMARNAEQPLAPGGAVAASTEDPRPAPPAAPSAQAPIVLAAPPAKHGNRLVGTFWVLLAAGLFQVVYFGAIALIVLIFGGADAVLPQLLEFWRSPIATLPVLFFFLLFELTVLLVNRAGRRTYVIASLVVGALVYVASVLVISVMVRGSLGDLNALSSLFLNYSFILIGLVAREVMLWTGLAIGSRGIRVRRRNRAERTRYDQEVADARG